MQTISVWPCKQDQIAQLRFCGIYTCYVQDTGETPVHRNYFKKLFRCVRMTHLSFDNKHGKLLRKGLPECVWYDVKISLCHSLMCCLALSKIIEIKRSRFGSWLLLERLPHEVLRLSIVKIRSPRRMADIKSESGETGAASGGIKVESPFRPKIEALFEGIVEKSFGRKWHQAVREWDIVRRYEKRGGRCVCGQEITIRYVLENRRDRSRQIEIGKRCIHKFRGDVDALPQQVRDGLSRLKGIKTDRPAGEAVREYAHQVGVINGEERALLVACFRKRHIDPAVTPLLLPINTKVLVALCNQCKTCPKCLKGDVRAVVHATHAQKVQYQCCGMAPFLEADDIQADDEH